MKKPGTHTHTVMPKKLAEALMEAGVQHFDGGGDVENFTHDPVGYVGDAADNIFGDGGALHIGSGSNGAPIGGTLGQIMGYNQYEAHDPSIQSRNFNPSLDTNNLRQSQVFSQQQNLANALMSQSNGTAGPSVAQNMLNQQTGNNASMQGALMASQRGASSNPALLARQAAMQGSQAQQQAAGQAATLRAQETLGAQNTLGNLYGQMGGGNLQQQNIAQGGQSSQNATQTQGQLGAQNINANVSAQNAQTSGGIFGGAMSAVGSLLGMSKGGAVPKMAEGGLASYQTPGIQVPSLTPYTAYKAESPLDLSSLVGEKEGPGQTVGGTGQDMPGGGGGKTLMPSAFAKGGAVPLYMALLQGGQVPGEAEVSGDSEKNDTQPALLSPGEIVLPRSVTQGPNMEKKALEFLRHLKGKRKGKYSDIVEAKACGGKV